jgi:hypothetical protein
VSFPPPIGTRLSKMTCRAKPVLAPNVCLGRRIVLVPFLSMGIGDNPAALSMCGMTTGRRCRFAWDYGHAQIPSEVPNCAAHPSGERTLSQALAVAAWSKTASEKDRKAVQDISGFAVTSPYFADLMHEYAQMDPIHFSSLDQSFYTPGASVCAGTFSR